MEISVELMVFLGIGIMLMAVIVPFIMDWDFKEDIDGLNLQKDSVRKDRYGFLYDLKSFWESCNGTGVKVYYVINNETEHTGTLDKASMFEHYKSMGWCRGLQSASNGCGSLENVIFEDPIELPSTVRAECTERNLTIS